jgi:ectoine hydroxylase-related dioxygenase (phytanoyl-CoA dioxygenase family)
MVGCLIAGSNCTYKNGVSSSTLFVFTISHVYFQATAVIPGSHLWGTDRAPKVDEVTYAEMEPGSALFTLGCK